MKRRANLWLVLYGLASVIGGLGLGLALLLIPADLPLWTLLFPAYLVVSGVAICFHSRFSAEFFLCSGIGFLAWALSGLIEGGFGRFELYGLVGSLITIHGYWVLRRELANHRRNVGGGDAGSDVG